MAGTPPVTGSVLPLHRFEMARLSLKGTKASGIQVQLSFPRQQT